MKNFKCFFIGHYSTFYDGCYPVCDRCGAHSYYDAGNYTNENGKLLNDWNCAGYLFKPFYFIAHQTGRIVDEIKWSRFAVWLRLTIWRKFGIRLNDNLPF